MSTDQTTNLWCLAIQRQMLPNCRPVAALYPVTLAAMYHFNYGFMEETVGTNEERIAI